MDIKQDIIIIGGGLAGLTAAIHLSKKGLNVTVIEKSAYPRHKVCGEYVSNEILPYLQWLGVDVSLLKPVQINKFQFSAVKGNLVTTVLPLGGFGISRYELDNLLYQKALQNGCNVIIESVTNVTFDDAIFTIDTNDATYTAKIVLGAYGKRSGIDQQLSRKFFKQKSPWLAVKAHYSGNFPDDTVALHNFKGGYCGVSKVEGGKINICYLADYNSFKKHKDIDEYQREVLYTNIHLKEIFTNSSISFEKPLTISQVSFHKKEAVDNHILMIGDTAGLIHPLCGNGMAMAIHSAKAASELISDYYSDIISRQKLEEKYTKEWRKQFGRRMKMGRILSGILQNNFLSEKLTALAVKFPAILPKIIKQTHGKPITIND